MDYKILGIGLGLLMWCYVRPVVPVLLLFSCCKGSAGTLKKSRPTKPSMFD